MYSHRFSDFTTNKDNIDFSNTCIWIINSDKIPPHIGISAKNQFFSLKATGRDLAVKTEGVFNSLKNKQIEFIIMETSLEISEEKIHQEFVKYDQAIPNAVSCLFPILRLLNINKPLLLVDLINYLEINKLILNIICLNLKREYPEIGSYSAIDVAIEIEKLQRVKGE